MPVGDDAEAVGRAKAALPPGAHVPDAVPVLPPSKVVTNPVVEGVVELAADDEPVIGAPKEACGSEPPKPEQAAMSLVERPFDVAPGEVPRGMSCVAPRGIPVGATGAAGPRPSGEVMPSGAPPTAPTWAIVEPGQSATASIAVKMNRAISTAPMSLPRRD
jgi:hypothetical protein